MTQRQRYGLRILGISTHHPAIIVASFLFSSSGTKSARQIKDDHYTMVIREARKRHRKEAKIVAKNSRTANRSANPRMGGLRFL
jgi:hypothetical protein